MLNLRSSLSKFACVFLLSNVTGSLVAQIAETGWAMQIQNPSLYLSVLPNCQNYHDGSACYMAVHLAEGKTIARTIYDTASSSIAYADNDAAAGFVSDATPLVFKPLKSDFESAQNQLFHPWAQSGLASISFSDGTPDVYKTQFLDLAQEWGFSDAQNSPYDWPVTSAGMRPKIWIVLTSFLAFLPFI